MHLNSLTISNFRKFGDENNKVSFVASNHEKSEENENSIASSSTLIVGKNNSGKTTITHALNKICKNDTNIVGNDFNFHYLKRVLDLYRAGNFEEKLIISFILEITVDISPTDIITNLTPFIKIGDVDSSITSLDLTVKINYEIAEYSEFRAETQKLVEKYKKDEQLLFRKFLKLIDDTSFNKKYYGVTGNEIKDNKFKLSNLIDIKPIAANRKLENNTLSSKFNEIVKFKYKSEECLDNFQKIEERVDEINKDISYHIKSDHDETINGVLGKIESNQKLGVQISSGLTFDSLLNNLVKYEYAESEFPIPESQFGLGYSSLMSIIGDIMYYIQQYPSDSVQSKINLISIEEPESFMHPQMQELFIKYINDAVQYLLKDSKKQINSQLIITTHSSHILNSKIHHGNSLDNINYIANIENYSYVVNLNDEVVQDNEKLKADESKEEFTKRKRDNLIFLKKHIKYKVSELFFSDAVIFVEGVTEETLLNYYIERDEILSHQYISIFNIDGAHGQVYYPLIKLLKIPALIITDLDIDRDDDEKNNYKPISDLNGKTTTNKTIKRFNGNSDDLSTLNKYFEKENLNIIFQLEKINGYYATSFEEAFILTNYDNEILNKTLGKVKPRIYKKSCPEGDKKDILNNSFKFQKKLSGDKSDFANTLLFNLIICEDEKLIPELPKYIADGLGFLRKALSASEKIKE